MEQTENEQKATVSQKNRWWPFVLAIFILLVISGIAGTFYSYHSYREKPPATKTVATSTPETSSAESNTDTTTAATTALTPITGTVWLKNAEGIPTPLGMVKDGTDKLSDFHLLGTWKGFRVVMLSTYCDGLGCRKPYNSIVVETENSWRIIEHHAQLYQYDGLAFQDGVTTDHESFFPELMPPASIEINREILSRSTFYRTDDYVTPYLNISKPGQEKINIGIRLFEKPGLGTIYTASNWANDPLVGESFTLKLPADMTISYSHQFSFIPLKEYEYPIPEITWNNGEANADSYFLNGLPLCMAHGTFYAAPDYVQPEDVSPIGTTSNGKTIYQFKDSDNPVVTKAYWFVSRFSDNTLSQEDFAHSEHGIVLYLDGFGHYIILLKTKFGFETAGCD